VLRQRITQGDPLLAGEPVRAAWRLWPVVDHRQLVDPPAAQRNVEDGDDLRKPSVHCCRRQSVCSLAVALVDQFGHCICIQSIRRCPT
jgi:hypothetical protein